jgi:hypothetical protein
MAQGRPDIRSALRRLCGYGKAAGRAGVNPPEIPGPLNSKAVYLGKNPPATGLMRLDRGALRYKTLTTQ